jgi:hypothetical protein
MFSAASAFCVGFVQIINVHGCREILVNCLLRAVRSIQNRNLTSGAGAEGASFGTDSGTASMFDGWANTFPSVFWRFLACQTSLAFSRAPASRFFVF